VVRKTHIVFLVLFLAGCAAAIMFSQCNTGQASVYKNIGNPEAKYVGIAKCSTCHADVYNTYIQTGMGQSWGLANKQKSAANFDPAKAIVYDKQKNLYYRPYWDGDSLKFLEFRLSNGDTVHKRIETIHYIVGSGQHTNSHIININGYLHQAPITFYTQQQKWDLAPGYETGNTRFDRKIEAECITCHNGYPTMVEGSLNKYSEIKLGIDCERCHGPGSLHADAMALGKIVDTSKTPDYSIVNPRRMTIDQQNNLCMRCHLQGVSALNDGKNFFDFQPSITLSNDWHVFLPEHEQNNKMIMASHVERMQMSACFTKSHQMSCITCHNPHISVKSTPAKQYNNACKNCHNAGKDCMAPQATRDQKQDNCYSCHMGKNESVDIPHVAVHDHRIVRNIAAVEQSRSDNFVKLTCYNNASPSARASARGYLEFFERYAENPILLDSAQKFLAQDKKQSSIQNQDLIRLAFLRKDYTTVKELASAFAANKITDAWNAYRIGESLGKLGDYNAALPYLQRSTTLQKYNLDFQQKLADCLVALKNLPEAEKVLSFIATENPRRASANVGLAFLAMQKQNFGLAMQLASTAHMLDPDNVQNIINLAVAYYNTNQQNKIKPLLQQALILEPNNVQVQAMLKDLQ
jgi:Flp pilus assembly protein TadD